MPKKISDRLLLVLESELPAARRFKDLEEMSGISSHSWVAVSRGRQRPTEAMIEFAAQQWPDYAYWLATGDTEPEFRHVAPETYEEEYPTFRGEKSNVASAKRKYRISLLKQMPTSEEERKSYINDLREKVFDLKNSEAFRLDFYAYEQYARKIGSSAPNDLYIIAADNELHKLDVQHWKDDKDLWLICRNMRDNIQTGKWLKKQLNTLKNTIQWKISNPKNGDIQK